MYSFLNYRRFAIAISNVGEVTFKKLSPEVRIHRVVPLLIELLGCVIFGAFHYYHYNNEKCGPVRVLSYEISQMLSAMAGVRDAEDKVDIEFILMTFWLNRGQETSVPIKKNCAGYSVELD
jgi:hypothetical protein